MINRVIWIILDSVGRGELPNAARFGDKGANTLGNIAAKRGKLSLLNMHALGLGNKENVDLKTGKTFADIGQTIAEIFGLAPLSAGESFLNKVIR